MTFSFSALGFGTFSVRAKKQSKSDHQVMNALNDASALIEFTPDGSILTANRNFLDLMGYSLEEVQGKKHTIFMPGNEAGSDSYKAFWRDLAQGKTKNGIFHRQGKDGHKVHIRAIYAPVKNRLGQVVKVVKQAMDVTTDFSAAKSAHGQIEALS